MIPSVLGAVRGLVRKRPPIYIALPVWGEAYVDVFLRAALPAQLSPGNLPALARDRECRYIIYTHPEDAERIEAAPLFGRLKRHAKVRFHAVARVDPSLPPGTRMARTYQAKSDCYRQCLALAEEADAPIVMLNADILMADGFLRHVARVLASGKRVLEVPGPRALKEPVLSELAARYTDKAGVIRLTPRQLATLWIAQMHPLMLRHVWDEAREPDDFHPSHLYWRVGADGMLAHCFHLYPIMVWPRLGGATFRDTIDDVLVESAAPAMADTDIPDSDAAFCIELSGPDHHVGCIARRDDDATIAAAYLKYGSDRNLELLRRPIRIQGETPDALTWAEVATQAERITSRLIDRTRGSKPPPEIHREGIQYEPVLDRITPAAGEDKHGNRYENDVRIAAGTELLGGCAIGYGTDLDDAILYPATQVGRYCSIGRGAAIGVANDPVAGLSTSLYLTAIATAAPPPGAELGHDVRVGPNATILAGVKVGPGAVVCANAVVTRDVRPYAIVAGAPAEEVRRRFPDEICDALLESCWWNYAADFVKTLPATDIPATLRLLHDKNETARADPVSCERLERRLARYADVPDRRSGHA